MYETLEKIDSVLEQVKTIEIILGNLKSEVLKSIVQGSKNNINVGMLDYKDLIKVTGINQTYVYREINRLKKKYKLTYKHNALPVNIVVKEFGISEEIISKVIQKNDPVAAGPK